MEKQNSELKFEVGKKYKFADGRKKYNDHVITTELGEFECHSVDNDGDCWSMDCNYLGVSGGRYCSIFCCHGWCICGISLLKSGEVIEVTQ